MNIKRKLAAVALTLGLLTGGSVVAMAPAQADTGWALESTKKSCFHASWGESCTYTKTYKRTSAFCAKPAGSLTGGLAAWYSYCYKTERTYSN